MPGPQIAQGWNQVTTASLVAQARAGGEDAFVELVRRHQPLIRRTALSLLRNTEDAEDVSQEVFISVFRKLHTFEENSSFSTWLTRIVINASLQQIRKARARPALALDEILDSGEWGSLPIQDPAPSPEQQCSSREVRRQLSKAVSGLPLSLRHVAIDHLYRQSSVSEIAERHGLSLAAAKSRAHRARKSLIAVLGQSRNSLAYGIRQG